jgi:rhodanese-related sulfurtransferase
MERAARSGRLRALAWGLAALGLLAPLAAHWAVVGRSRSVSPAAARVELGAPGSASALVDVRSPEEFTAGHIDGAASWSFEALERAKGPQDLPEALRGRRLFLICDAGILSAMAERTLRAAGIGAASVEGGIQAWTAASGAAGGTSFCRLRVASGNLRDLPRIESPPFEQWAAVLTGFVVKPIYTLVSLILVAVLWRSRAPDLSALRWACIAFFIGENFCAANYLLFTEQSPLLEFLHSLGMVTCFSLVIWAILEGLDLRLVRFSEPAGRCAAAGLCRGCVKVTPGVPCGLKRAFLWIIPALAVLALPPLTAQVYPVSYNTEIFGTLYNYSHAVIHQLYEIRFLPAAALALLAASFLVLRLGRKDPVAVSKVLFAAGAGALSFGWFRWILLAAFREDLAWFGIWEELTELVFMASLAGLLWTFRGGLFPTVSGNPGLPVGWTIGKSGP